MWFGLVWLVEQNAAAALTVSDRTESINAASDCAARKSPYKSTPLPVLSLSLSIITAALAIVLACGLCLCHLTNKIFQRSTQSTFIMPPLNLLLLLLALVLLLVQSMPTAASPPPEWLPRIAGAQMLYTPDDTNVKYTYVNHSSPHITSNSPKGYCMLDF